MYCISRIAISKGRHIFSKSITCHIWSKNTLETWVYQLLKKPFKQSPPKLKINFFNFYCILKLYSISHFIVSIILHIYILLPITSVLYLEACLACLSIDSFFCMRFFWCNPDQTFSGYDCWSYRRVLIQTLEEMLF